MMPKPRMNNGLISGDKRADLGLSVVTRKNEGNKMPPSQVAFLPGGAALTRPTTS